MKNLIIIINFLAGVSFLSGFDFLAGGWQPVRAQNIISPVRSHTVYSGVGSPKMREWLSGATNNLEVNISLLDASVSSANICLKMCLEGRSSKIENNRILEKSFRINGGESIKIRASELLDYFAINNLSFGGIDKNAYINANEKLPEGDYTLYFEVYEEKSRVKVSLNEIPAHINIKYPRPPELVSPMNKTAVYEGDNLNFMWTMSEAASLKNLEYTFEMVKIPETYASDYRNLFTQFPLVYKQKTSKTSLNYDISLPPLEIKARYAFRVKAECLDANGNSVDFVNDGYSDIFSFDYREVCPAINNWKIDSISAFAARLTWSDNSAFSKNFRFVYRKRGNSSYSWFSNDLQGASGSFSIYPLEAETEYECIFFRTCEYGTGDSSVVYVFRTRREMSDALNCGEHPKTEPIDLNSVNKLELLRMFDEVICQNGFVFTIDEVSGDGTSGFSGTAHTKVPLLANTGVKVKFSKIFVSDDYRLIKGEFKAVTSSRKI